MTGAIIIVMASEVTIYERYSTCFSLNTITVIELTAQYVIPAENPSIILTIKHTEIIRALLGIHKRKLNKTEDIPIIRIEITKIVFLPVIWIVAPHTSVLTADVSEYEVNMYPRSSGLNAMSLSSIGKIGATIEHNKFPFMIETTAFIIKKLFEENKH